MLAQLHSNTYKQAHLRVSFENGTWHKPNPTHLLAGKKSTQKHYKYVTSEVRMQNEPQCGRRQVEKFKFHV